MFVHQSGPLRNMSFDTQEQCIFTAFLAVTSLLLAVEHLLLAVERLLLAVEKLLLAVATATATANFIPVVIYDSHFL